MWSVEQLTSVAGSRWQTAHTRLLGCCMKDTWKHAESNCKHAILHVLTTFICQRGSQNLMSSQMQAGAIAIFTPKCICDFTNRCSRHWESLNAEQPDRGRTCDTLGARSGHAHRSPPAICGF